MKSRKSIVSTMATLLMIIAALFFVGCDNGNGGGGTIQSNGTNAPTNPSGGGGIEFTITYWDGDTEITDMEFTEYLKDTITYDLAAPPAKEGYTFFGWYTNKDFEGEPVTSFDSYDAEHKNFYARYIKAGITVIKSDGTATGFEDIALAIEEAAKNDGSTVKLEANITQNITFPEGNFTLDLNGFILKGTIPSSSYERNPPPVISNRGTLTIVDTSTTKLGVIEIPSPYRNYYEDYYAVSGISGGTIIFKGGTIRGLDSPGPAIKASSVTMDGGTIISTFKEYTQLDSQCGIYASSVTMKSGSITLEGTYIGGIIYGIRADIDGNANNVNMEGGSISIKSPTDIIKKEYHEVKTEAKGIYVSSSGGLGGLTISGGKISVEAGEAYGIASLGQPLLYLLGDPTIVAGTADISGYFALAAQPTNTQPYSYAPHSGYLVSSDSYTIIEADLTKFKSSHEDYELRFIPADAVYKPRIDCVSIN